MKAAILDKLGDLPRPGVFQEPDIRRGETLVHVRAAAIKPIDRAIAAGTHYSSPAAAALPVVCGMDGVGALDDGARVYFSTFRRPFGAMAERAPAAWTVPVPDGLSDPVAAAVVNPALAAWLPLMWRGKLRAGETVLVLGATGAAGRAAINAARTLKAGRIIAAGRRLDVLEALGADATIDLNLPERELAAAFAAEAARGIGVVLDYLWGRPVEILIESLMKSDLAAAGNRASVRLVSIGEMAGRHISLPSSVLRGSRLEILGSGTANFPPKARMRALVADILASAADAVSPMAVNVRPLSDVSQAWADAATAQVRSVIAVG